MNKASFFAILAAVMFWSNTSAAATPVLKCDTASLQAIAPAKTTITSVEQRSLPSSHCRVRGFVTNDSPGPNDSNFVLALPDAFAGRYLMLNLGGNSGYVVDPENPAHNNQSNGYPPQRLAEGFAFVSTDTGNQNPPLEYTFLGNRAKALDQAWRGTYSVAVATQAMTRAFYGAASMYRYAYGCSGGGRLGLATASVHPEIFDGTVAGAPATFQVELAFARVAQYLKRNPQAWISPEQLAQVQAAVLAKYDAADGAVDGMIWDPRVVKFDQQLLPFLTPAQVKFLQFARADVVTPKGELVYRGYALTDDASTVTWLTGKVPPDQWPSNEPLGWLLSVYFMKAFYDTNFDVVKDLDLNDQGQTEFYLQYRNAVRWSAPGDKLAQAGLEGGQKIIVWVGVGDPAVSGANTIELYKDTAKAVTDRNQRNRKGKRADVQDFLRLYLAPGIGHCTGGPGPQDVQENALKAMIAWVEQGRSPTALVASRKAQGALPDRSFLVCPYPQQAAFSAVKGNDFNDASLWSCRPHYK